MWFRQAGGPIASKGRSRSLRRHCTRRLLVQRITCEKRRLLVHQLRGNRTSLVVLTPPHDTRFSSNENFPAFSYNGWSETLSTQCRRRTLMFNGVHNVVIPSIDRAGLYPWGAVHGWSNLSWGFRMLSSARRDVFTDSHFTFLTSMNKYSLF